MKPRREWIPLLLILPLAGCSALAIEQGGFNMISLGEEWLMRDDLMSQVEQEYTLIDDAEALAYLEQIGLALVAQSELADLEWTFGIVDDDAVNAFNLPGGLVYVNRGLVEQARELDQFTAVLGHEIAHGAARHGTQLMTRAYGLELISAVLLGDNANSREELLKGVVGSGVLSSYGRDAEREADRLGIRYAFNAGYDPEGAVRMFQMLLSMRESRPSEVGQFFSSHPLTEDRIAVAQQIVDSLPPANSPIRDSADYQAFRKRLAM